MDSNPIAVLKYTFPYIDLDRYFNSSFLISMFFNVYIIKKNIIFIIDN